MKTSKFLAALALGAACTLPVMAQSTSGAGTGAGSAGSGSAGTSRAASPDTRTMGSGPSVESGRTETRRDGDRDLGWLGLLGLAGLLGLRRKHDDRPDVRETRTTGGTR